MDKNAKDFNSRMKESLRFVSSRINDSVKVPNDFTNRIWEKIGEPNPSLTARLRNFIISRRTLITAGAGAFVIIVVMVITGIFNKSVVNMANKSFLQKNTTAAYSAQASQKIENKESKNIASNNQYAEAVKAQETRQQVKENAAVQREISNIALNNVKNTLPLNINTETEANEGRRNLANAPAAINAAEVSAAISKQTPVPYVQTPKPATPVTFEIKNNMIHPLNGDMAEFDYSIVNGCNAVIRIYDRKGRLIKNIYSGSKPAGTYTEYWKGDNDSGAIVDAGIYILYARICDVEKEETIGVIK